jgi:hypothetical protein
VLHAALFTVRNGCVLTENEHKKENRVVHARVASKLVKNSVTVISSPTACPLEKKFALSIISLYYHIALPIRLFPTTLTSNRGTRTRCPCSRPCGAVCLIGRRRLQLRSACACAVARGCGARGGRWQRKVVKHTILLRSLYGPILPPMWALYVPCRQLFRNPMLFFA